MAAKACLSVQSSSGSKSPRLMVSTVHYCVLEINDSLNIPQGSYNWQNKLQAIPQPQSHCISFGIVLSVLSL